MGDDKKKKKRTNILLLLGIFALYPAAGFFIKKSTPHYNKIPKIEQSIVTISSEEKLIARDMNPGGIFETKKNGGVGTGFFVSERGKIVTAKHIVPDSKTIYKVRTHNGKIYDAKVIYHDKNKDIAIIQTITKNKFIPLKITKNLQKGEPIITFGTHIGTQNIVHHYGQIGDINTKKLVEISSPLQPGFSGGPVINGKGKVVGINYGTYQQISLITPILYNIDTLKPNIYTPHPQ